MRPGAAGQGESPQWEEAGVVVEKRKKGFRSERASGVGWPLDQVDTIPRIDFKNDLTGRLRMLDMRWKVLDRAINVSSVPAPGDAAI